MSADQAAVLIAEDDPVHGKLVFETVRKAGYEVELVTSGTDALSRLQSGRHDVLITDWIMPKMDGMQLIRRARAEAAHAPLIIMVTALSSAEARKHAMASGADEFIAKPIRPAELRSMMESGLARRHDADSQPTLYPAPMHVTTHASSPFAGVAITASTGGPLAVKALFESLPFTEDAAFMVVLHGPDWMQQACAESLQRVTKLKLSVVRDTKPITAGHVYLAPGNRHLVCDPHTFTLSTTDEPMENFVRPSADPLFRSVARTFGKRSLAVVLTGLGSDGARGAMTVQQAGGSVLVQDPHDAAAPSMPRSAVARLQANCEVLPLARMASAIHDHVRRLTTSPPR